MHGPCIKCITCITEWTFASSQPRTIKGLATNYAPKPFLSVLHNGCIKVRTLPGVCPWKPARQRFARIWSNLEGLWHSWNPELRRHRPTRPHRRHWTVSGCDCCGSQNSWKGTSSMRSIKPGLFDLVRLFLIQPLLVNSKMIRFVRAAALVCSLVAVASIKAADAFPVSIRVDAGQTNGELKPIWRFFGADEPNYAYMKNGQKLVNELGALRRKQVYFRAHNLLTSVNR